MKSTGARAAASQCRAQIARVASGHQVADMALGSSRKGPHSCRAARGLLSVEWRHPITAGSHALSTAWPALMGGARATVPAGGLLAYDARTYHRGLSNLTEHSRPALVFRYDRRDERPPPGVGLVEACCTRARRPRCMQ